MARCPNAPLSAASRAVPAPPIPTPATAPITASPARSEARLIRASSRPNRPPSPGGRSRQDNSFGLGWRAIGRVVRLGPIGSRRVSQRLRRGDRKRGLSANLQNEIAQEIETLLGSRAIADLDLEAVEMAARRQALRLAARALEQRLNADPSDHAGPKLPCSCGGSAQYRGRHPACGRRVEGQFSFCVSLMSGSRPP